MKFIIAISTLLACALSSPTGFVVPVAEISAPIASQYHSQDDLGQYAYGYSNHLSAKSEARALDGSVLGSYTYLDANGKIQSVEYTADDQGFRVAASNLPVAPLAPEIPAVAVPLPVQDTPEVVEARSKHLAAVEEVKSRPGQDDNQAEMSNSVEVPIVKTEIALKNEGKPIAIASSLPVASLLPLAYRSAVYATPGVAIKSFVAPAVAVRAAPVSSFAYSYGINNVYGYNALYHYPGFAYTGPFAAQVVPSPIVADHVVENVEAARAKSDDEQQKGEKSSQ